MTTRHLPALLVAAVAAVLLAVAMLVIWSTRSGGETRDPVDAGPVPAVSRSTPDDPEATELATPEPTATAPTRRETAGSALPEGSPADQAIRELITVGAIAWGQQDYEESDADRTARLAPHFTDDAPNLTATPWSVPTTDGTGHQTASAMIRDVHPLFPATEPDRAVYAADLWVVHHDIGHDGEPLQREPFRYPIRITVADTPSEGWQITALHDATGLDF